MTAAEIMTGLELTKCKDRWVHVQARGQCTRAWMFMDERLLVLLPRIPVHPTACSQALRYAPNSRLAGPLRVQACSAKTGEGLEEGMAMLMKEKNKGRD
jgi:hypothetical protein